MISNSNKQPTTFGLSHPQAKPPIHDKILKVETAQIERKNYMFALRENSRGRFLRITEKTRQYYNSIIVPASGLKAFKGVLNDMTAAANEQSLIPAPKPEIQPREAFCKQAPRTEKLEIERRIFLFTLNGNAQGHFLQLLETCGSFSNSIVIPASGLEVFNDLLAKMAMAASGQSFTSNPVVQIPSQTMANEDIIKSAVVQIEFKSIMMTLKENQRNGRFLRITEKAPQSFTCLFIPSDGLEQLQKLTEQMEKTSKKISFPFNTGDHLHPLLNEHTIDSEQMLVGNKTFRVLLQENVRGRYLRLIEESPGHHPSWVIIPSNGLEVFNKQLDDMVKTSKEHPLKNWN